MVSGMSQRRFRRIPAGVSWLGPHLVWCPKYRRRILGGRLPARCGELLEQIAEERGWQIAPRKVVPDHVQLFVRVDATEAPAVARTLQGRTAGVLGQEFRYLCNEATVLWSPSYLVASVGCVWESTVRGDIAHQCDGLLAS